MAVGRRKGELAVRVDGGVGVGGVGLIAVLLTGAGFCWLAPGLAVGVGVGGVGLIAVLLTGAGFCWLAPGLAVGVGVG